MRFISSQKYLVATVGVVIMATVLVNPTHAEWLMDRHGNLINQSAFVLGESTDATVPELDELFKGESAMQQEFEMAIKETSQPASADVPSVPGSLVNRSPKVIPRSGINQVRISAPEGAQGPPSELDDIFTGLDAVGGSAQPQLNVEMMPKDGNAKTTPQNSFKLQKGNSQIEFAPSVGDPKTLEMRRDQFKARLPFPVKIDPVSQEIRVESPVGDLPIRIMPDEAQEKMSVAHQLSLSKDAPDAPQVVDGKLLYTYEGTQNKKLFGFIPVVLNKKVTVSAEDGVVTEGKQTSLLGRFLDYWAE
ncbi:MAG: hypothetical protein WCO78_04210 [Candidatus Roizmanbacteria bacterium]